MTQITELPSLYPLPDDLDDLIGTLLHQPTRPDGLGEWLLTLTKSSGHLSLPDDMRWRLLAMLWLAVEFDTEAAWPYLMWFNQGQPQIADHLADLLYEAINEYYCHIQVAQWMAQAEQNNNEKLITFFDGYQNTVSQSRLPNLLKRLQAQAKSPAVGIWLRDYCHILAQDNSPYQRRWRILVTVWYTTCFAADEGLQLLEPFIEQGQLSLSGQKLLQEVADELGLTPAVVQWIADCPDERVREILKAFGHPNLDIHLEAIFERPPDFAHLKQAADHAPIDVKLYHHFVGLVTQTGFDQSATMLDLACGPLAPQTLLFASSGYRISGVDLHIPPTYWPVNFVQRLTRGKYVKAWEETTADYYAALRQASGLTLSWKRVKIELADMTRLKQAAGTVDVVLCSQYLHHAPDVTGLLAEVARVLKPNGVILADIRPYPALTGAFLPPEADPAWAHLRRPDFTTPPRLILNQWREAQYRTALAQFFTVEQWLTTPDELAQRRLTPDIQAELADFSAEELTRLRVLVVGRKSR